MRPRDPRALWDPRPRLGDPQGTRSRLGAPENGTRALGRATLRAGLAKAIRIERFGPLRQAFALPRGGCCSRVFRSVYSVDIPYDPGSETVWWIYVIDLLGVPYRI